MHILSKTGAIVAAIAAFSSEAAALPSVEAFGNLPLISQPRLSPDGKHIAMIQPLDGRPAVVIYTVGAPPGTQPAGIKDSAAIIETVDWANNDRLIVVALISSKVNGKVENFYRALSADVTGSNVVTLFKDADPAMSGASEIADFDLDDPDHVFMPNIGRTINGWRYSLYRVNVSTGTAEFVRA